MSLSRRLVLTGAAVLALGAAGGGSFAWAQENESTGSETTTAVEPSGDDTTVTTGETSDNATTSETADGTTSSESAGDDTTAGTDSGEGEAPVATATESEARFTG